MPNKISKKNHRKNNRRNNISHKRKLITKKQKAAKIYKRTKKRNVLSGGKSYIGLFICLIIYFCFIVFCLPVLIMGITTDPIAGFKLTDMLYNSVLELNGFETQNKPANSPANSPRQPNNFNKNTPLSVAPRLLPLPTTNTVRRQTTKTAILNDSQWRCNVCTVINNNRDIFCSTCGESWRCPTCTLINSIDSLSCDACAYNPYQAGGSRSSLFIKLKELQDKLNPEISKRLIQIALSPYYYNHKDVSESLYNLIHLANDKTKFKDETLNFTHQLLTNSKGIQVSQSTVLSAEYTLKIITEESSHIGFNKLKKILKDLLKRSMTSVPKKIQTPKQSYFGRVNFNKFISAISISRLFKQTPTKKELNMVKVVLDDIISTVAPAPEVNPTGNAIEVAADLDLE